MKLKNIFACFDTRTEVIQQTWYCILQLLQSVSSVHLKLKSGPIFMAIDLSKLNLCIKVIVKSLTDIYHTLHNLNWMRNKNDIIRQRLTTNVQCTSQQNCNQNQRTFYSLLNVGNDRPPCQMPSSSSHILFPSQKPMTIIKHQNSL